MRSRPNRPLIHLTVVGTAVPGAAEPFVYQCIGSLVDTTRDAAFSVRTTAVDNSPGSGLGSGLRARFPTVEVVENAAPRGLAANHNAALAKSGADYFLIANDDIRFLPGAVARAVSFLEEPANARVGVVGFQLLNPDGSLQPSTYSFPTVPRALLDLSGFRRWIPFAGWSSRLGQLLWRGKGRSRFWAHDQTLPVQTFRGAVMLVRAGAAREVGPMDEVSLVGGEETDWHRRFWRSGWSVVFLHDAPVIHYGSQTIRHLPQLETEFLKGLLNFFWKHRSRGLYYAFCALAVPLLWARYASCRLLGRRPEADLLLEKLRTVVEWGLRGVPRSAESGLAESSRDTWRRELL